MMNTRQSTATVLHLYEMFDQGALDEYTESIDPGFSANVLGNTTLDWEGFKK
jgi:ketosteroid isomerase-like protein